MLKLKKIAHLLDTLALFETPDSVSVDLGCGDKPRNPLRAQKLAGIDVVQQKSQSRGELFEFKLVFAGQDLPFEDNSVDCVSAYDFLEHLPRTPLSPGDVGEFIRMMNEIYRILKPGGVLVAVTPYFPKKAAFTDPTHVNFITRDTHLYFSGDAYAKSLGYGFEGSFDELLVTPVGLGEPSSLWGLADVAGSSVPSVPRRRHLANFSSNPLRLAALFFTFLVRRLRRRLPKIAHHHLFWALRKT